MSTKLHQVIAVEKGIKTRVYKGFSENYKLLQKPALFDGQTRTWEKKDADGDDFPDEAQKVQHLADQLLRDSAESLVEHYDVVLRKDEANCRATADVKVDGQVILPQVPVTTLLFLEKQLSDMASFIDALPVLDPAYDWKFDQATGLHKTEPQKNQKTKKVQKPIVLYPATEQHPAQTQLVSEDQIVGYWSAVRHSGALPAPRKKVLQERVRQLQKAVKFAREEANATEVKDKVLGKPLFDYLLA